MIKTTINATRAAARVIAAAVRGHPVLLTDDKVSDRLAKCVARKGECFNPVTTRCCRCNCMVFVKARLSTEVCPMGFWEPLPIKG